VAALAQIHVTDECSNGELPHLTRVHAPQPQPTSVHRSIGLVLICFLSWSHYTHILLASFSTHSNALVLLRQPPKARDARPSWPEHWRAESSRRARRTHLSLNLKMTVWLVIHVYPPPQNSHHLRDLSSVSIPIPTADFHMPTIDRSLVGTSSQAYCRSNFGTINASWSHMAVLIAGLLTGFLAWPCRLACRIACRCAYYLACLLVGVFIWHPLRRIIPYD
jgi:hypothetical protein